MKKIILSIDPGRKKCGVALVDSKLKYIEGKVILNEELIDRIKYYLVKYNVKNFVVGGGTNSENIIMLIREKFPEILVTVVEEKDTTRQARKYFFEYNPPSGWLKLFPITLLVPPRPYDDFAAYVIGRRFFLDFQKKKDL